MRVVDRLPLKGGGWSVTFVASIAAIAAGSVEAAARLIPQLEPWSGRFAYLVNAVWFGPADRLLGDLHLLAGHTAVALRNYDRALAQSQSARARPARAPGIGDTSVPGRRTGTVPAGRRPGFGVR